jgi:hypothetical protein
LEVAHRRLPLGGLLGGHDRPARPEGATFHANP